MQIKASFGNMIGLAFQTHAEFLEPVVTSNQPAKHDDGGAQVRHMGADATGNAFGGIQGDFLRIVFGEDTIALFSQHPDHVFGDRFFRAGHREFRRLFQVFDEWKGDIHLVLLHRAPDARKAFIKTGQGIDAEHRQETGKPPGVIDVRESQPGEPAVRLLTVFLDIGFRPFALLNYGADRGRHRQDDEEKHGQFDRGKKGDEFGFNLVPTQTRRLLRRVRFHRYLSPSIHALRASWAFKLTNSKEFEPGVKRWRERLRDGCYRAASSRKPRHQHTLCKLWHLTSRWKALSRQG